MRWLELKVPPAVLCALVSALMIMVTRLMPELALQISFAPVLAFVFTLVGSMVAILGVLEFRRLRTTVNPTKPQSTTTVVTTGVYRLSRNPMYLGLALLLLGQAIWESHPVAFLGVPAFILYMNRFQILAEERALVGKFGSEYLAYMTVVRRWI